MDSIKNLNIKKMGACVLSTSLVVSTAQMLFYYGSPLDSSYLSFGASVPTLGDSGKPEDIETIDVLTIDANGSSKENSEYKTYFAVSETSAFSEQQFDVFSKTNDKITVAQVNGFSKKAIDKILTCKKVKLIFPNSVSFSIQTRDVRVVGAHAFDCKMTKEEFEKYIVITSGSGLSADDYDNYIAACKKITSIDFNGFSQASLINKYAFRGCNITSIGLTQHIKTIGQYCFAECNKLEKIEIPQQLQTIMDYSFYKCGNLNNFTFNNVNDSDLKSIGNKAFAGCTSLTKITIPPNVTSMGQKVFEYSGLETLTLSNGIKTIYDESFKGCLKLTRVNLPDSLETISRGAFAGCENLKSINIPQTVTTIADSAFGSYYDEDDVKTYYCSKLETVYFNSSSQLTVIGDNAFEYCNSLIYINLEATKLEEIGDHAFYSDVKNSYPLKTISFPATLKTLGPFAFANSDLSTITWAPNSSIESIGERAFSQCIQLKKIYIPASVQTIDKYAFYKCTALSEVTFDPDAKLKTIGSYAFGKCYNIEELTIPASVKKLGTYIIGGNGNTEAKLKKLTILPGLETIDEKSFAGCSNLTEVVIPYTVTEIKYNAFANCGFKMISIPGTVETIERNAFEGCENLKYVFVNRAELYQQDAFPSVGCTQHFVSSTTMNGIRYEVDYDSEKNTVTAVVAGFDENYLNGINYKGETITIPESVEVAIDDKSANMEVTKIKPGAFEKCEILKSIKTPKYLTSIGARAFANCSILESVDLTNSTSLLTIESEAFTNCPALKSVVFNSKTENQLSIIGDRAFYICPLLSECNINDCKNLTKIGDYAFAEEITNSEKGTTSKSKPLHTTVSRTLFSPNAPSQDPNSSSLEPEKTTLYSLYGLDKLETIGDHAFHSCNLYHVYIPKNVKTIGKNAFQDDNGSIYNLYFYGQQSKENNGVDLDINEYAFKFCENIKQLNIPSRVKNIKEGAFSDAVCCTKITLNEGLETIGALAFAAKVEGDHGYAIYKNLVIPSTVREIGSKAFSNVKKLDTLLIKPTLYQNVNDGNTCIIANDAFADTNVGAVKFSNLVTPEFKFSFLDNDGNTLDYGIISDFKQNVRVIEPTSIPSEIKIKVGGIEKTYPIKKLGDELFKNNKDLKIVTIPDSITQIGNSVFQGCSNIMTISLPGTITYIGDYAFAETGCSEITISMPTPASTDNKNFFGTHVFHDCKSLTKVTFNFRYVDTTFKKEEDGINYAFSSSELIDNSIVKPINAKLYVPSDFFKDIQSSIDDVKNEVGRLLHIDNKNIFTTQETIQTVQENQHHYTYSFAMSDTTSGTGTSGTGSSGTGSSGTVGVSNQNITKGDGISNDNEGIATDNESSSNFASNQLYSSITSSSLLTDAKLSSIKNNEKVATPLTKMLSGLGDKSIAFVGEFLSVPSEDPSITLSNCTGKTAYIMFVSMDGKVVTADGKILSLEEVKNLSNSEYEKLAAQKIDNIKSGKFTFKVPHSMYIAVIIK